jgi:ABC-type dipeptide/oligopeptide/nickel transport system permease subunit
LAEHPAGLVLGYAVGTYGGWITGQLMRLAAQ